MIQLTHDPIDTAAIMAAVADNRCGASLLFLGTTREFTGERQTTSLTYECYPQMAASKLQELHDQALEKWPIIKCQIMHRLGHVGLGEASVAVAVSAPHRGDAFQAGQWLIDTLKEQVPIWKQEHWADGTTEWVHPQ